MRGKGSNLGRCEKIGFLRKIWGFLFFASAEVVAVHFFAYKQGCGVCN